MKESIFLIGGSGFVGKNIVKQLSDKYDITVFDKNIDSDFFNLFPDVITYKIDLIEEIIPKSIKDPSFIINLASIVTAERTLSLFDALISSNLKILLNLFQRFNDSKSLKLFIQFGSSEEYGKAQSPYKETDREQPVSPYALVKQLTTNTALMLHSNYNFPSMVVRPGNLFGQGQQKTKFLPYVIDRLKMGEDIDVTPCEQKRDFIDVVDFVKALQCILLNPAKCVGEIINISSGISISLKDIIETVKSYIGSESKINYGAIPYRENEAMDLRCDTTKIDTLLKEYYLKQNLTKLI